MVNLFAGIPDTTIESALRMIKGNLDKVGLYGGHTLRRHTDIQVMALKSRLTREDIWFATFFGIWRSPWPWRRELCGSFMMKKLYAG